MGLRVDFRTPIDGGAGRIDLMRVMAHSWQDANDFGAGVVFSSQYPSAQAEEFSAAVGNVQGGGTAAGNFYPSRRYGAPPMVFANYQQTDGAIITPYFFNQVYNRPASGGSGGVITLLERQECFQIDVVDAGGGTYRVDWVAYNYGPGASLLNGIVRARVVGKGA